MSLAIPQFGFSRYTDNLNATTVAWPPGLAITPSGTDNVDSTPQTLVASVDFDVHYLVINLIGWQANGQSFASLVDILYDPAGGTSWQELIPDLAAGQVASANRSNGQMFFFPIWVPSGSSLGVRSRCVDGTRSGNVIVYLFGDPRRPDMWWVGQRVEALGVVPASSDCTAVTPGELAWGSWTNIGGLTTYDYGALQIGSNGFGNGVLTRNAYWEVGSGSVGLPVGRMATTSHTTEEIGRITMPAWVSVKAGSQLQIRGTSSVGTQDNKFAIYGVY